MAKRVKVTASQKYNDIERWFPTATLAGLVMDELIVATDGNISFKVEVEEVPVKMTEEKGGDADAGETAENTDED